IFDAQILAQLVACRFRIGEVSCPTKYFREASSIGLASGIRYAWGCVIVAMQYALHVSGVTRFKYLEPRDALTTLNVAVLAPMPIASDATITSDRPALLVSVRTA